MRDLNEDSNSSNWPLFYGDKTFTNGQYCNGFMSRTKMDAYPGYNKDVLKEKMLEHESIFKDQVILILVVNVYFSNNQKDLSCKFGSASGFFC